MIWFPCRSTVSEFFSLVKEHIKGKSNRSLSVHIIPLLPSLYSYTCKSDGKKSDGKKSDGKKSQLVSLVFIIHVSQCNLNNIRFLDTQVNFWTLIKIVIIISEHKTYIIPG
jgi:hypothetical protein